MTTQEFRYSLLPYDPEPSYNFSFDLTGELRTAKGTILFAQGRNRVGIPWNVIIGWKESEPYILPDGSKAIRVRPFTKEERGDIRRGLM